MRQTSLPRYTADPIDPSPIRARGFTDDADLRKPITPPVPARAVTSRPGASYARTNTIDVGSQVVTAIGKNEKRSYLMLQNNGTTNIYLSWGGTPRTSGNNSAVLPPNAVWTFEAGYCPINELRAVSATGSTLSITEGSYL